MTTHTIRVRPDTWRVLLDLARERGESVPDALDRIIEESRRSLIFQKAADAYAAIAADPVADAAWRAEISAWDVTVGDGLEPESDAWDAPSRP